MEALFLKRHFEIVCIRKMLSWTITLVDGAEY